MPAPGETDLAVMLASLDVVRRPGVFTYVEVPGTPTTELAALAHAVVVEDEGTTVVVPIEAARAARLGGELELAWLTLTVHSSLEAVGLTAAFSAALGDAGISCNVLAGYRHDHLLVPDADAERAIEVLRDLAERSRS
ncbi:MAG: ACT domain-containing protein [Actinomycetota bacterium]